MENETTKFTCEFDENNNMVRKEDSDGSVWEYTWVQNMHQNNWICVEEEQTYYSQPKQTEEEKLKAFKGSHAKWLGRFPTRPDDEFIIKAMKALELKKYTNNVVDVSIIQPQFTEEMIVKAVDNATDRLDIYNTGCDATAMKIPNIGKIKAGDYNGLSYDDTNIEFKSDDTRPSVIHLIHYKIMIYEFDTETSFATEADLVDSLANKMVEYFVELGIYVANFTARSFHNRVVILVKYGTRDNC